MKWCIVTFAVPCMTQKEEADIWSPSSTIIHSMPLRTFIKNKGEVLAKFKDYITYVENQGGDNTKVKVLRTDNGGEYTSKDFVKYCAEKGISHQFTNPYCPEQNGVAERLNRTIIKAARSMIYQDGLPLTFWAEACNTAIYVHNRSPTTALRNKTPYE